MSREIVLTNDYEGVDYIDPNYGPQMELRFLNLIVFAFNVFIYCKTGFWFTGIWVSQHINLFTAIGNLQEIMRYANIGTRRNKIGVPN